MPDILKLSEERNSLIKQARDLVDASEKAGNKSLTAEEQTQFDKLMASAAEIKQTCEREKQLAAAEKELAEIPHENRAVNLGKETATKDTEERKLKLFRAWITEGPQGVLSHEERDLEQSVLTAGGSFVPPLQWVSQLIKAVDNLVFIRQIATKMQLNGAHSLGAPSLDADPSDPVWTNEVPAADPTADTSMATGSRELKPSPLIKLIKLSKTLLRNSVIPVESLVMDRLAYKFAVTEENAYLNGNGANQPLGVFTASSQGISTGRDVSTDNTTTAMTYDGLVECKYTVKSQYWPRAIWIFHRDGQKQLVKIKNGDGEYIWRESVRADEPDTLLGRPIRLSEYCPNTFTTGLYVGIFGDFSNYWIVDSLALEVQRLLELYTLRRQVGFVADKETDGMPVLEEAFARVKLA